MLAALGEIGAGRQSSKRLEVVDKMRLIEIAAGQRQFCPSGVRGALQHTQDLLKAPHAAKLLGRQSHRVAEHLDEACLAEADALSHRRDAWRVRAVLEFIESIADRWMADS